MKYEKIGVFLSSKENLPDSFRRTTEAVGALIGRTGRTLVYGGARKGLMEVLARSVKASGGTTYGVVPQVLFDRGEVSGLLDITVPCVDLNDRKAIMLREGALFVALPGGIGTLDEVFTVMAAGCLGAERKRVVLYNVDGCWDATIAALHGIFSQGLASGEMDDYFCVVESVEALEALLK